MSKSGQEHWLDRFFKGRLDQYELKPSDDVWENIAKHLDGEKRRPFLLGNWLNRLWALIFLAVVAGLITFLWLNNQNKDQKQAKQPMDLPDLNSGVEAKGTAFKPHSRGALDLNLSANDAKAIPVHFIKESSHAEEINVNVNHPESQKPTISKFDKLMNTGPVSDKAEGQEMLEQNAQNVVEKSETNKGELENLIASTELLFMSATTFKSDFIETDKIPGLKNFVKTKTRSLDITKMAEGCNVYRNDKTHFFVDAYYAPELAKRSFSVSDPSMLSYAEKRANTEKPILSYTAGLRGSVVFGNGLAFRTGLQYSNNSERFDYIKETQTITIERKDKNGTVISIDTQIIEIMDQSYNHFRSFDIPFIIGYEKDLKDFVLSLNGGIGFNLSTRYSGKIYQPDQKTIYNLNNPGEGSDLIYKTKVGLSFITSVGLNYKYNERIMLMLEPSARFYFKSITEDAYPVQQKYVFFGLNVGLRYRVF